MLEVGDLMGKLSDIVGKQTAVGKGLAVAQAVRCGCREQNRVPGMDELIHFILMPDDTFKECWRRLAPANL